MANLLTRLDQIGVVDGMSDFDARAEIIANRLLLVIIAVTVFFLILMGIGAVFYREMATPYLILQVSNLVVSAVAVVVRMKFGRVIAVNIAGATTLVYFTLLGMSAGQHSGVQAAFFAYMAFPFFVFKKNERKSLWASYIAAFASIGFLVFWFQTQSAIYPVDADIMKIFSTGFLFVVLGTVAFLSFSTWDQTYRSEMLLATEKQLTDSLLGETIPKLEKAENKYRHLVEDSRDIVFSLDSDGNFLTVNKAIGAHLTYNADDLIGKPFTDIMYSDEGDRMRMKQLFKENLNTIRDAQGSFVMMTRYQRKHSLEPKDMSTKIESVIVDDRTEFLGKAIGDSNDRLRTFTKKETVTFYIDNLLSNAQLVSDRLTQHLGPRLEEDALSMVRMSLGEMIVNAIEHGNLNIQFGEKSKAIENGRYFEFVRQRQQDEQFSAKRVKIEYKFSETYVAYRITDQGAGFDHRKQSQSDEDINDAMIGHGRGINITRTAFDKVIYNDKGNQVVLFKKF